jgi:tetratricopeptide (TPR) repeat protein
MNNAHTLHMVTTKTSIAAWSTCLDQAAACVIKGDDEQAEVLMQNAFAETPDMQDAYAQLGHLCRLRQDWERAQFWMQRDYHAGTMSAEWKLRYAEVLAECGKIEQAEGIIAAVYQHNYEIKDGYARIGAVYMRRHEWSTALAWMQRDRDRISPQWKIHYAVVLTELGRTDQAARSVEQAYQENTNITDGYARIGAVYMRRHEWSTALAWMQRDRDRISPQWKIHYAVVLTELGRTDQAARSVEQAYQENTNITDGYARMGAVSMRRKDWAKARKWMRKDAESQRMSPSWLMLYALVLAESDDPEAARSVVLSAYQKDPAIRDGFAKIGSAFMTRKDWHEALIWMQYDHEQQRMSPDAMLQYALLLARKGEEQRAHMLVEQTYQADPKCLDGYANIGLLFTLRGEWDKAIIWMEKDIQGKRISPLLLVQYARALGVCGELPKAKSTLQSVLTKPHALNVNIETFLTACDALFFLTPDQDVSEACKGGLVQYPQCAADILTKIADIKQSATMNQWVLSNSRLLAERRPRHTPPPPSAVSNWQRVVESYEKAQQAGALLEKSNSLSKMVVAGLFYSKQPAPGHRGGLHPERLKACFKATVSAQPNATLLRIPDIVNCHASNAISREDTNAGIEEIILNQQLALMSRQWLAISDILIWCGLFQCAYLAWERSIPAAYEEADAHPGNANISKHAFKAAMIAGDYARAAHYLKSYRETDARAYLALHLGKIEEARQLWRMEFGTSHQRLEKRLYGQNVGIVGPAPTEGKCVEDINACDVVIRTSYTGNVNKAAYGNHTTASHYTDDNLRQWAQGGDCSYLEDLEWYTFGNIVPSCKRLLHDLRKSRAFQIFIHRQFYYKPPNAIQRILYDLLHYRVHSIKIFKTTFYLSNSPYGNKHTSAQDRQTATKPHLATPVHQSVSRSHDFICQLAFTRNLWRAGIIQIDNAGHNVLEMTNQQYMQAMEQAHGFSGS